MAIGLVISTYYHANSLKTERVEGWNFFSQSQPFGMLGKRIHTMLEKSINQSL
jgi:hypothetical protein